MKEFLKSCIKSLMANNFNKVHIVLGNTSCDLDSAITAIIYAMFLHYQYITSKYDDRINIFVPVLNINREDYDLKTEVVYCLSQAGVTKEHLIFRDTLDLNSLSSKDGGFSLILVDHHILSETDAYLQQFVNEILDHRPRDVDHWNYSDQVKVVIEKVGSCTTLVVMRLQHDVEFVHKHPEVAAMLHATIILDTVNFSQSVNKGTQLDLEMVQFLEGVMNIENPVSYRKSLLSTYVLARSNVSSLTSQQLLRKDVKFVGDIMVPTFPILVEEFMMRPDSTEALSDTIKQYKVVVLIGTRFDDPPTRDIAVYSDNINYITKMCELLESWSEPNLDLTSRSIKDNYIYYKQNNLTVSRKQILPILNIFISSILQYGCQCIN